MFVSGREVGGSGGGGGKALVLVQGSWAVSS